VQRSTLQSLLLLALAVLAWPVGAAAADEFGTVIGRYRGLLAGGYAPGASTATWEARDARTWIDTLAADGRWPDIDYENRAGGAWPAVAHLRRIRILAREFTDPKSPLHQDAATDKAIFRALNHWTTQRYQNPNWWQNQIGVPQVMRDIIVLLGDRLTGDARNGAMAVLRQLKLMDAGIGANTVWSAELALMAAALEQDAAALANASRLIAGEITQGGAQGIQDDFSFHQHGARLQQFHYGGSFFQDTVRIAWLLRGTVWALPEEKVGLLADYADRGNLWMSRGGFTVPSTLDRAVSRPGALAGADIRTELTLLAEAYPVRREELRIQKRMLDTPGRAIHTGFRAFPRSDFAVYHDQRFSFFLKTISLRTETTETLLRENRRGRKLNWGDHYILTAGSNYAGLPPVWDWELLPGVTSATDIDTIQRQAFVGAIGTTYSSGAAVMDYAVGTGEATTLTARKFWVTHSGRVVGLIGALNRTVPGAPVRTALDQRRLQGPVTVEDAAGVSVLPLGKTSRQGVRWILHDGLLYVPLGGETVSFSLGPVTGSWNDINLNYGAEPVTEPIFLAVLEHGTAPASAASGFVILPCNSVATAKKLTKKPAWTISQNDATAQAVKFSASSWMVAFHAAGKTSLGRNLEITVDAPCLLLCNGSELRASDPTQAGRTLQVRVGTRQYTLVCPPGGKTSAVLNL
jgi:chondroitin AC lyase